MKGRSRTVKNRNTILIAILQVLAGFALLPRDSRYGDG
jgi:hypothetical protein